MHARRLTLVALGCSALAACADASGAPPSASAPRFGPWGVDLTAIDPRVRPGDDFYRYANGRWLDKAVIPPDRAATGMFEQLDILSEDRMNELVQALDRTPYAELDDEQKKLRDLYDAFVDTQQIEARGLAPAEKDLRYFASLETHDDVARAMGSREHGAEGLFDDEIGPDPKHSTVYAIRVKQAGLGLPDRDFYLKDEPALAATREAYKKHLATMLALAGAAQAAARADAVYELEHRIAEVHWPAAARRDAEKTYNPMTLAELAAYAPGFPWPIYFAAQGVAAEGPRGPRKLVVRENTAFPAMAKIFASTPVEVWRDWLTLHYLHKVAAALPARFDRADFDFYGKVIRGEEQQLPRQTRGVRLLNAAIGEALGKLYVARYFPPPDKAKAEQLVGNLLRAYDADLRALPWMTAATKERALAKLHALKPHVGYPTKWRDYSRLAITRDDLLGDVERSRLFAWRYHLDRIDRPVDRDEWEMTPPTVNAYYEETVNALFVPAAILQPPFFDPKADDAVNYGGIGVVIGHEISHGFDDQGRKYDAAGNLENWWTRADLAAFEQRAAALAAQFDQYEPLPGLHVNGQLTLGEDIADLAGLANALAAYHVSLGGKPARVLDGFTGDERFFLGFAQVWRAKYRDAALRERLLSDPHSPPAFRVIGATRNVDGWYAAFGVLPGARYFLPPKDRVYLW